MMLSLLLIVSLLRAASPQAALELYQRALVQEQAAGNLQQAIDLYKQAAKEAGTDRGLAARALIRAAGAYEKLGDTAAAELYSEVMRTYPEQREEVALAQTHLAALKRVSPRGKRTDVSAVFDPMFEMYCVSCHSQTHKTAGLALDTLNTGDVSENPAVWERILRRLRARRDPPLGARHPDEGVYLSAVSSAELALDHAYPANSSLGAAGLVTDAELAVRMARFIWNGPPDAALNDAAQRGTLQNPSDLEQQVRRMLQDPKAANMANAFLKRWLLWDFPSHGGDEALQQAFLTETQLFLENQIREDHNALDLWTANYSFLNDRVAQQYGISGITGSEFRRVQFPDNRRAGILGQGSFLSVSSATDRTSPVERGKMILELFFGTNPPDPPPNVPPIKSGGDSRAITMRARMEEHHTNPACMNCHLSFEPIGLALENFNQAGQWRNTDAGAAIDASGTLVDGTRFNGAAELRAAMLKYRDAYYSTVTQKMLGYALGREGRAWRVYDYEMPSVRAIVREAAAHDYRWSAFVLGIVKSTPFQMKTIVP